MKNVGELFKIQNDEMRWQFSNGKQWSQLALNKREREFGNFTWGKDIIFIQRGGACKFVFIEERSWKFKFIINVRLVKTIENGAYIQGTNWQKESEWTPGLVRRIAKVHIQNYMRPPLGKLFFLHESGGNSMWETSVWEEILEQKRREEWEHFR